jgi:limonene-1,2-epoxide hydrolase
VKFWRNKTLSKTSGDTVTISVSASELQSIGATSGRVSVITAAGQAVSVDSLTITP